MLAISIIQAWLNISLIRANFFVIDVVDKLQDSPALSFIGPIASGIVLAGVAPTCSGALVDQIKTGVVNTVNFLLGLGVFVTVLGIIIGGLMRATAFGNERRIAASNTAITGAVVGMVIVVLSVAAGETLPTWFGVNNACKLS